MVLADPDITATDAFHALLSWDVRLSGADAAMAYGFDRGDVDAALVMVRRLMPQVSTLADDLARRSS